jgi:hypothetical protein
LQRDIPSKPRVRLKSADYGMVHLLSEHLTNAQRANMPFFATS